MFDFERAIDYIRSLELPGSSLCEEIQLDALAGDVSIIRPETASFLLFLISLKKPLSILEVGTAVGYSAIRMSEVMPAGATITTIEKYPPRIEEAKRNFARAPRGCDITLLEGDAADILKTLDKPYDLIFMDAAKGQYPVFLREAERLLSDDGVIVADNVLFNGMVATGVPDIRRNKTIVKRLAEFLRELEADLSLKTVILPISDGVTVSVRIGGAEK